MLERPVEPLVLRERALRSFERFVDLAASGGDESGGPRGGRETPRAVETPPYSSSSVRQLGGLVDLAEPDERLDRIRVKGCTAHSPSPVSRSIRGSWPSTSLAAVRSPAASSR